MGLRVTYKTRKARDLCTDASKAQQVLGLDAAKKLARRVKEMESCETFEDLFEGPGRWKPLKGDLKGAYSADISGRDRIIVSKEGQKVIVVIDVGNIYH